MTELSSNLEFWFYSIFVKNRRNAKKKCKKKTSTTPHFTTSATGKPLWLSGKVVE
jgi:hypothetical protein